MRAKPRGRQGMWAVIRSIGGTFTLADLVARTSITRDGIAGYLNALVAAGYVERCVMSHDAAGRRYEQEYRLVRDIGVEAPAVDRAGRPIREHMALDQMWRTIKMLRAGWTAAELAIAASLDDSPVSETQARDYARLLAEAGYLARGGPRRKPIYSFLHVKNTGSRPPRVVRAVYDPNTDIVVWHSGVES